jgi:hypothetical protein
MRSVCWIIGAIIALSSAFEIQTAHAFYDCVVTGDGALPVYVKATGQEKVASVPARSIFYTAYRIPSYGDFDRLAVHKFEGNDFVKLGYMQAESLDCDGDGITSEYPITIRDDQELTKAFGLVGDHEQKRKIQHEKNKCFWKGEADLVLSMSDAFLAPYKERVFPFNNLCISLKAGDQIRFDPETGTRMPTYARLGTQFNEEYLLIAPSCFAFGKFEELNNSGITSARLRSSGCRLNFHPWSGRPQDKSVVEAFSKFFALFVGGEAGSVNADSKSLAAKAPSRILTLARIDALRDQMKMK